MKLLGTIAEFGPFIALKVAPNCYYPLGGPSDIASDFRDTFGTAGEHDIGKRLYRHSAGHLCLETLDQSAARGALRDYAAARELERIAPLSAFHVNEYSKRRKLNQHAVRYEFPDRSAMVLYLSRRRADAWHFDWKGRADDVHLGPVKGAAINVNRSGD